jgi:hypothetical protein
MEADGQTTDATALTVEQMKARVQRGFLTERNLLRLGWFILALAIVGLITVLALWLLGEISIDQALASIFEVVISSILSGAATYGSGINVGLASARLATNLPREEADEPETVDWAG